jgi:hypothetical protein
LGPIEKEWLEQEEWFRTLMPALYDPETGITRPLMVWMWKPYVDELLVWMEREQRDQSPASTNL